MVLPYLFGNKRILILTIIHCELTIDHYKILTSFENR